MQEQHKDFRKLNTDTDDLNVAWNELKSELNVLYRCINVAVAPQVMQNVIKMQIVVSKNKPTKKLVKSLTKRIAELKTELQEHGLLSQNSMLR